jgi:holo-[acyl-carrier protein] synthase
VGAIDDQKTAHGNVVSMLIGTGIDVIEIERIAQSIQRFGDRFLRRVYTDQEIAYCSSKRMSAESFAARFAAKEAGAKALGTGISRGVTWNEFQIERQPGGRPTLELRGRAQVLAAELGVKAVSLSLTHTGSLAMATVMMEG